MSRGVNKVILIGNLGADPDMRYMPSGDAVANISIATSESWQDKQTGEQREKTQWHRVVAFRRLGEIIGQYCRKGSKIYIEGRLQTRKWTDNQGVERYTTEIIADQMQMLDSRSGGDSAFGSTDHEYAQQSNQSAPTAKAQTAAPTPSPSSPQQPAKESYGPAIDDFDDSDDDIPF